MKKTIAKKTTSVIRTFRNVDNVYNTIVNPITFCEITWEDLSDILPFEKALTNMAKSVPYLQDIGELYDTFTIDKDIAETIVSISLKIQHIGDMDGKQRSMLAIKAYTLAYKLTFIVMACCGVPKTHEHMLCILDYVNFILSNISE
jgi:hypothetical protein